MRHKALWVWVEGRDDLRFFETILRPVFEKKYDSVLAREYAALRKRECGGYLRTIKARDDDYLCVTDIDEAPCVTERKQRLGSNKFCDLDPDRAVVVVKEIEGWYLAGLDKASSRSLGIRFLGNTDQISKERFDNLMPKRFDSRKDFMVEMLKRFDMEIAKQKNQSFRHLLDRHCRGLL